MYRMIIVEDDEIVCNGLARSIDWKAYGVEVVGTAFDGEYAVELIEKLVPDVVVTDICMPFMDGLELASLIGESFPYIKVILLTAYKDFQYARRAIKLKVSDYLVKPVETRELIEAIQRACREIEVENDDKGLEDEGVPDMQDLNYAEALIYAVKSYIDENFSTCELNLETIARASHISISYLCALFKQFHNTSPINYLNKVRIGYARKLLVDSRIKSYEVAQRSGYRSPQYFSYCFKQNTGMSPTQYRRAYMK